MIPIPTDRFPAPQKRMAAATAAYALALVSTSAVVAASPAAAPPNATPARPVARFRVLVVPLRYDSPPSASQPAIESYGLTIGKITQPALQAVFAPLPAWWARETYGLQNLDVTVLPAVDLPGSPGCDFHRSASEAAKAAANANAGYDRLIAVTPYACWSSHMATENTVTVAWNTYPDNIGKFAHELGHTIGLGHAASRLPNYALYGNNVDQMGPASGGLGHWLADHKEMLGVLKPGPCASAKLRSIYAYPDAIRCGAYVAEYLDDWHEVWISKREHVAAPQGASDTTVVAKLAAGQAYSADGYTFMHVAGGQVRVTKPSAVE